VGNDDDQVTVDWNEEGPIEKSMNFPGKISTSYQSFPQPKHF
jgi:hypothetical protein